MQMDLSNQVIARIGGDDAGSHPRRTLDLGNIYTPELGLLSPRRKEIAPRGLGRDAALVAYSERLRQSYRTNEGGIRDGMLKLGEAYRNGQPVAVSCFCRAGEMCHADVVKMAVEKVGQSLVREATRQRAKEGGERTIIESLPNPRTQRAVNEILSVGRSDLLLAKLEDTEGRNRSEHASHLNRNSQFVRDLYERGAVVRDGVLIAPRENPSSSQPLALASMEYAVKRLEFLVDPSRARELAPKILEYGTKIAGESADRDTKIEVFNWIYGALAGRNALLKADDKVPGPETKEERFDRTLNEIASVAEEMSKLEPSDRSVQVEHLIELEGVEKERSSDDLSLERVYEDAISLEEHPSPTESDHTVGANQEFERIELEDTTLSRLAADMSKDELDRWINVRLPVLDEMLESGTPVDTILKPFQKGIYEAAKNDPANRQPAIDDLRFASAYIKHQLKQPESRLRHFNPRYREYAAILERASSREEVIDAASRIRLENAQVGFRWNSLPKAEKAETPRPLTSKEMQFLFTETSPRHYTSEMTAARLAYVNAGDAARTKTDALMRGEVAPSKEAMQLVESLESRMERKDLKDSLSATKHFLQSLKTPNEDLRYKNSSDHAEVYRKLPPAERDFVYQRAVEQKAVLESKLLDNGRNGSSRDQESVRGDNPAAKIKSFRESLKGDLIELLTNNPGITGSELRDRTSLIIERNLEDMGSKIVSKDGVRSLSRELGEGVSTHLGQQRGRFSGPKEFDRGTVSRGAPIDRVPSGNGHER